MLIPIQADGNCFFRCVALLLDEKFRTVNRNESGRINNKYFRDKETNFAKFLRYSCVNVIETDSILFNDSLNYDGDLYESIEDRISKMYMNNELVGRLEMQIISKMYKINFNIFVIKDGEYNLVNNIGSNIYRKCNLLLEDNHYSFINQTIETCAERPCTPRFIFDERHTISIDDRETKSAPVAPVASVAPVAAAVEPIRHKSFNIPPPLCILSPNVSPIEEEISYEIKSYIDTNISMAKVELLEVIKREMGLNNKMVDEIEKSAAISNSLQELIEKLHKNN